MTSVQPPPYEASQTDAVANVQLTPSAATTPKRRGNWKGLRVTGFMQVTLGLITVLFGFISIVYKTSLFFIGSPIWSGILFFIPSGILGIAAGGKRNNVLVCFYMAMSIVASCFACVVIIIHGIGIGDERICPDYRFGHRERYTYVCSISYGSRTAIDSLIILIALVEMILGIVSACLTCSSLCQPTPPCVVTYRSPQQMILGRQPPGVIQYSVPPQQQFGNVYPTQVVQVPAGSLQYQPQGQMQYHPGIPYPPQQQVLVQGQFQQGPVAQGQFQQGPVAQGQFQQGPVAQGQFQQGSQVPQWQFQQGPQAQVPQAQQVQLPQVPQGQGQFQQELQSQTKA